ncbi:MAG: site-2 protease family protein, partial [Planctomycetota bacterium]
MNLESIILVFYIIVGIGSIIFVHELGHFVSAKLSGVRVEAFSLGFYPTFFGFKRTLQGLIVSF